MPAPTTMATVGIPHGPAAETCRRIVFITDGECILPDEFINELREKQTELGFSVTGTLLDADRGMDFSLKEFCEKVYRTSELMGDEIVRDMVTTRL